MTILNEMTKFMFTVEFNQIILFLIIKAIYLILFQTINKTIDFKYIVRLID